jgi:hypothetical protein
LPAFARTANADVFASALLEQESNMTADMISVSQCIALSGLGVNEVILGVTPTKRHDQLCESYLLIPGGRYDVLRDRIVGDIRASLELGARRLAADLLAGRTVRARAVAVVSAVTRNAEPRAQSSARRTPSRRGAASVAVQAHGDPFDDRARSAPFGASRSRAVLSNEAASRAVTSSDASAAR